MPGRTVLYGGRKHRLGMRGRGMLMDLLRAGAKKYGPSLVDLGASFLKKKLEGGRKRRVRRRVTGRRVVRKPRYGGAMRLAVMPSRRVGIVRPMVAGRKRRIGMRGRGFFGDLWSGLKSVAGSVKDIALPIATGLITKRLGGRRRMGMRRRLR